MCRSDRRCPSSRRSALAEARRAAKSPSAPSITTAADPAPATRTHFDPTMQTGLLDGSPVIAEPRDPLPALTSVLARPLPRHIEAGLDVRALYAADPSLNDTEREAVEDIAEVQRLVFEARAGGRAGTLSEKEKAALRARPVTLAEAEPHIEAVAAWRASQPKPHRSGESPIAGMDLNDW